jgi:hypothetical protein
MQPDASGSILNLVSATRPRPAMIVSAGAERTAGQGTVLRPSSGCEVLPLISNEPAMPQQPDGMVWTL